jgi:alpha-beta hydrolase superfamily lysophospholipase
MSHVGVPAADLFAPIPFPNAISMPFYLASKMWALANDPTAMKIFMADKTSAGAWTSMKFLSSFMNYEPAVAPEQFTVCPILLTQPAVDYWTPLHLAELFLKRVKKVDVKIVMLENAGHYPLEQPGLQPMHDVIISFPGEIEASLET